MYDIKPLEEEWEKYRKRKRKPYILLALSLSVAGAIVGVLLYTDMMKSFLNSKEVTTSEIDKKSFHFIKNRALERLETNAAILPKYVEKSSEIVEDLPLSDTKPIHKKPRVKMHIVTSEMPKVKRDIETEERPHKRIHLTIKETSATSAYRDVAQRFRETQDIDDSLFLARTYYHKKAYKKAEYWALQTNNIDSSLEESIFIFVKAKAKRGHKNEAIRILSKYIKESHSREAKSLLKQIRKGRF